MATLAASEGVCRRNTNCRRTDSNAQRLAEIDGPHSERAFPRCLPFKVTTQLDDCASREVNLDYVEEIRKRVPHTIESLLVFALGQEHNRRVANVANCCKSDDVQQSKPRYTLLGGFEGDKRSDRAAAHGRTTSGGGYAISWVGSSPINGWCRKTLVLGNGFHASLRYGCRITRSRGSPNVSNAELEFLQILGLPRNYLLQAPDCFVKDFFDQDLVVEPRLKPRRKVVKVSGARG